jgi:hypothetical protein
MKGHVLNCQEHLLERAKEGLVRNEYLRPAIFWICD